MNRYLESAREAIDTAAGGLPLDVLARRVDERWSIVQILEHLTLAFTVNTAALETVVASGEPRAHRPRPTQALARILVVDLGYFPRVQAPEVTVPRGTIAAEHSLDAIRESLTRLDDALARVAARVGTRVPVANHPYFAGLTVPQWQKFHWRHVIHHMAQVRRLGT